MKTLLHASLLLLFILSQKFAYADAQPVPSKIDKVTVFIAGAQVNRIAETKIPAGRTELVFKDISPRIDKQSIQIKGDGAFTILSVSHQLNYLQEQQKRQEIAQLEAEKGILKEEKQSINNLIAVYKQEQKMLEKNQSIGGANNGVATAELRQAIDYHRERMTLLFQSLTEAQNNIARIDSAVLKLDKQLTALNKEKETATSEIIVTVSAKSPTSAKFEISYYVLHAGWFATYDFRVKDVSSPIDIAFKANVYQQSGEDWNEVQLTLSNGNPTESSIARALNPWYLRYGSRTAYYQYPAGKGTGGIRTVSGRITDESGEPLIGATVQLKGMSIGTITDVDGRYTMNIPPDPTTIVVSYVGFSNQEVAVNATRQDIILKEQAALLDEVVVMGSRKRKTEYYVDGIRYSGDTPSKQTIPIETQQTYQPTNFKFEIVEPYTIPSDGKTRMVDIKAESVPAEYQYFTAPKIDETAYLTAKVPDWQDLNLLDGEVNLFFEGAYLGKSLLDTREAEDTLEVSLGADKGIVVQRTKLKDYSSRRFLGSNKTETRAFEITVRNNKPQPVRILVQDQFPISTDKEISVEDLSYPGAKRDRDTEILTWDLELAPKEEKKMNLKYGVKYPNKKNLVLE